MLILLPPSEGKTAPRRGRPLDLAGLSSPELTDARAQVLDALVDLCAREPETAMTTLGIPKTQPELVALDARLRTAPTATASAVYSGVLYDALDAATLSPAAKRRLNPGVAVASALFGLVGMGDRIPAYRLSGDAVLPGLGSVAAHWRAHLPHVLGPVAEGGLVVDLRSSTYAAFWRPERAVAGRVATVRVLHEQDGKRTVVSHFNKATKGRVVRALLEAGASPRTPAALAGVLRDLGWTVEEDGSRLDIVVSVL